MQCKKIFVVLSIMLLFLTSNCVEKLRDFNPTTTVANQLIKVISNNNK
jgi:hypothetical protein